MPITSFEIRVCRSCGLRYPITEGNAFGIRCPDCLGETEAILLKHMDAEYSPSRDDKPVEQAQLTVLLDNIRSAWNVGSILRSADGFGFSHAYLCGITPSPNGPAREAVTKTSLGAEDFVIWSEHKNAVELVETLKREGWKIYVLEETKTATELGKLRTNDKEKAVLILGSEVTGVDPELLGLADEIIAIPMQGGKRSFNVSIAFAIAAYALRYNITRAAKKTATRSKTKLRTISGQ